jgi:hypothetical protein
VRPDFASSAVRHSVRARSSNDARGAGRWGGDSAATGAGSAGRACGWGGRRTGTRRDGRGRGHAGAGRRAGDVRTASTTSTAAPRRPAAPAPAAPERGRPAAPPRPPPPRAVTRRTASEGTATPSVSSSRSEACAKLVSRPARHTTRARAGMSAPWPRPNSGPAGQGRGPSACRHRSAAAPRRRRPALGAGAATPGPPAAGARRRPGRAAARVVARRTLTPLHKIQSHPGKSVNPQPLTGCPADC